MPERQMGLDEHETLQKAPPGASWRNTLMAVGFFCFLAALLVGASMKEAAGAAPKILALVAIGLIAISGVASLINRIVQKGTRSGQQ